MKISVLIPVYNDFEYLENCLQSVIRQTYQNLEIIIVNDGSTDNSKKIIDDYAIKDKRITVINQKNSGVCIARNKLIQAFTGDYAIFLDGDDYLEITAIEKLVKLIDEYDSDLITFDYTADYTLQNQKEVKSKNNSEITVYSSMESIKSFLFNDKNFDMVLWRRCYKKDLLKKIEFKDKYLPEDYFTSFDIYRLSNGLIHYACPLYNYRVRKNSLTIRKGLSACYYEYLVYSEVFKKEYDYFIKDEDTLCRIREIYVSKLFEILSWMDKYEMDEFHQRVKKEIALKIKELKKYKYSKKLVIAFILFNINNKLLFFLLDLKSKIRHRRRNKN